MNRPQPPPAAARAHTPDEAPWSARWPILLGIVTIVVLCTGLGYWAIGARLAGAVVAPGYLVAAVAPHVLQHEQGGRVLDVTVTEGAVVRPGDVILRLDPGALLGERELTRARLAEILARQHRWRAERDDLPQMPPPPEGFWDPDIRAYLPDALDGQRASFDLRRESHETLLRQLQQRISQIDAQTGGLHAQAAATAQQITLLEDDLASRRAALDRGLGTTAPVTALQRDLAVLTGRAAELQARTSEIAQRRIEAEMSILQRQVERREAAATELRDLALSEEALRAELAEIDRRLDRMAVTAPVAGEVFALAQIGPGGVVRPGEPIAQIVPRGGTLRASVAVAATDIDAVHPGQRVELRFPGLPQRTMLPVAGHVDHVAAGSQPESTTGTPIFRVDILLNDEALAHLPQDRMRPGMPVTAFLRTVDRRPIDYLVAPLWTYLARALREE